MNFAKEPGRSEQFSRKHKENDHIGKGLQIVKSNVHVSDNLSKDDYIKKLQEELEQLKGERGLGSSSQRFRQFHSHVSALNNTLAGQKVRK